MRGQVTILRPQTRALAMERLRAAPDGLVMTISEPRRSKVQSDKMWAMLTDVSIACPGGRKHTADRWKMVMMQACGHEVQFEIGLDNLPFPVGFKSKELTVRQMTDLITFIYQYGDEHGVKWSEPHPDEGKE